MAAVAVLVALLSMHLDTRRARGAVPAGEPLTGKPLPEDALDPAS